PITIILSLALLPPLKGGVMMVGPRTLRRLVGRKGIEFVFPDEDVSRRIAKRFFSGRKVTFRSAALRWDGIRAFQKLPPDEDVVVSFSEMARKFLRRTENLAGRSSDWARQIGLIAVMKDGQRFAVFNEHMPPRTQYVNGDPRSNFEPGEMIECSTALHCERALIAEAASRKGMSLRGAKVYVTTFPCVGCAQQLAKARIASVYFKEGYANLNGRQILRDEGVRVIRVAFPPK
ncbi:MAG: hypothetical protein Q8Q36_00165, partial [bacterium]|nr:hypothetical protein [bacterium]